MDGRNTLDTPSCSSHQDSTSQVFSCKAPAFRLACLRDPPQIQLKEAQASAEHWRAAFKEVAVTCGFAFISGREPDVAAVVDAVRNTRSSSKHVQVHTHYRRPRGGGGCGNEDVGWS